MKKLRHISLILLSALLLASCGTKEALETTQAAPPRGNASCRGDTGRSHGVRRKHSGQIQKGRYR